MGLGFILLKDCGVAAVAGGALGYGNLGACALQIRTGPAYEGVARLAGIVQREALGFHGVACGIGYARCQRAAIQIIGNGVGNCTLCIGCGVGGIRCYFHQIRRPYIEGVRVAIGVCLGGYSAVVAGSSAVGNLLIGFQYGAVRVLPGHGIGVLLKDCGVAAVAGGALGYGNLGACALQIRTGPAYEGVARLAGIVQREALGFHGVACGIGYARCQRAAIQIIGNGVGNCTLCIGCGVGGIRCYFHQIRRPYIEGVRVAIGVCLGGYSAVVAGSSAVGNLLIGFQYGAVRILPGHSEGVPLPNGIQLVLLAVFKIIVNNDLFAHSEVGCGTAGGLAPAVEHIALGSCELAAGHEALVLGMLLDNGSSVGHAIGVVREVSNIHLGGSVLINGRECHVAVDQDLFPGVVIPGAVGPADEHLARGGGAAGEAHGLGLGVQLVALAVNRGSAGAVAQRVGHAEGIALAEDGNDGCIVQRLVDIDRLTGLVDPLINDLAGLACRVHNILISLAGRNRGAVGNSEAVDIAFLILHLEGHVDINVDLGRCPVGVQHQIVGRHGLAGEVIGYAVVGDLIGRNQIPTLERGIGASAGRLFGRHALIGNGCLILNGLGALLIVVDQSQIKGGTPVVEVSGSVSVEAGNPSVSLGKAGDGEVVLIIGQAETTFSINRRSMVEVVAYTVVHLCGSAGRGRGRGTIQRLKIVVPGVLTAAPFRLGHGDVLTGHLLEEGVILIGHAGLKHAAVSQQALDGVGFPHIGDVGIVLAGHGVGGAANRLGLETGCIVPMPPGPITNLIVVIAPVAGLDRCGGAAHGDTGEGDGVLVSLEVHIQNGGAVSRQLGSVGPFEGEVVPLREGGGQRAGGRVQRYGVVGAAGLDSGSHDSIVFIVGVLAPVDYGVARFGTLPHGIEGNGRVHRDGAGQHLTAGGQAPALEGVAVTGGNFNRTQVHRFAGILVQRCHAGAAGSFESDPIAGHGLGGQCHAAVDPRDGRAGQVIRGAVSPGGDPGIGGCVAIPRSDSVIGGIAGLGMYDSRTVHTHEVHIVDVRVGCFGNHGAVGIGGSSGDLLSGHLHDISGSTAHIDHPAEEALVLKLRNRDGCQGVAARDDQGLLIDLGAVDVLENNHDAIRSLVAGLDAHGGHLGPQGIPGAACRSRRLRSRRPAGFRSRSSRLGNRRGIFVRNPLRKYADRAHRHDHA